MSFCLEFLSQQCSCPCWLLCPVSSLSPIISLSSTLLLFLPLLFDLLISSAFLSHCFQILSKNQAISSFSTFFLWSYYWKYFYNLLQCTIAYSYLTILVRYLGDFWSVIPLTVIPESDAALHKTPKIFKSDNKCFCMSHSFIFRNYSEMPDSEH